jgi:hypothetical protein
MKYVWKKARRIRIYDLENKKHKVTIGDLKTAQWTSGNDTVYAEGTDGARLAAFDIKKVSNFKATSGAIDTGYIALQVGSDETVVVNGTGIKIREEIPVTDTTSITLGHKAQGTVGNEVVWIYCADSNGNPDAEKAYTQAATASATEFAYAPDTKVITLPTDKFEVGDTVIIDYYPKFSKYTEISNDVDKFSFTGEVIIDAWFTDPCIEKDVPLQAVMQKGKISGNMDYSFGDQAAIQNIDIESMVKNCNGSTQNLWKLYNYNMEDVTDV